MIQIKAPDGSLVQFPDGTDDATITKVMGENFPPPKPTTGDAPAPANGPPKKLGPLAQLIVGKQEPETTGRPASLTDVAASAMTFGLTNDMAGLSQAAGPAARFVGNKMGLPVDYQPGEVTDAYSTGRNNAVRKLDAYREQNPWTAFAGDMAGGIANPVAKAGIAAPGASMLQKALLGGKVGAGMGAGYGFGNTEGDLGDRGMGAVTGGLVGGAVGTLAAPVVEGVGNGVKWISDYARSKMGATNQASVAGRKVAEALQRDGITPTQAAQLLTDIGPDAVLADLGKNSQALAGSVTRAPGKGGADLTAMLTARQEGTRDAANVLGGSQSQRIMGGIDRLIPDKTDDLLKQTTAQRARAGGNYERAKNSGDLVDIAPMLKSLDDEIAASKGGIRSGLERVRGFLVDKNGRPEVTIDTLHQAKMAVDDLMSSGDARNSMGRVAQGRIKDYQSQLLSAIEGSGAGGAEYAAGRGATSAAWRTQEALESGTNFMNRAEFGNVKELAGSLAKMTPEDQHAFRMGAAQALKGKLDALNTRSDATKRVMDMPALEEKIRAAFGDQQTFKRYIDMLKGERTMFNTYGEVTGNSKTAARLAADADLNADPGGMAQAVTDIARNPANPMNYLAAAGRFAGDAKARMATPEPVRNQIANMMMMNDPLSAPQLTRSMQQVQMSEANRRKLARALLGTGSSAGGYFNR